MRRVVDDPLIVIGEDLMMQVFGYLDARSLALSLLVSRSWFSLASSDSFWSPLCQQLWAGKAHIPRRSKLPGQSKLASYSSSIMDSKRKRITREDLCDHAWNFHFTESVQFFLLQWVECSSCSCIWVSKILETILIYAPFHGAAPAYWKNLDPHWRGTGPLMHRYFHPDGSLTCGPDDVFWGGHECSYTIVTSIWLDTGKIREHYVRINRWPRLVVSRRDDWGWELSNVVFSYSSIPDAEKDGGTGPSFLL